LEQFKIRLLADGMKPTPLLPKTSKFNAKRIGLGI